MKNKNLVVGAVVVAVFLGFLLLKPQASKQPAKKAQPAAKGALPAASQKAREKAPGPAKKAISKDKGALLVKALSSNGKETPYMVRAFKAVDSRSSLYVMTLTANRVSELLPGAYDIEVSTVPSKIYKNVRVAKGEETVENLGTTSGSLNVKALDAQKKDARYFVRVLYPKSTDVVASMTANRPFDILPGTYDVDIGTTPRYVKKDVRIEAGKEMIVDLGCVSGTLMIKTADESGKEVQYSARITRSENNEAITTASTNRPTELLGGLYNIELFSAPKQVKKDVMVKAGEETVVEFTVQTPPSPAPRAKPK